MTRHRTTPGAPGPSMPPQAAWLAGAMIGMTIMAMAAGAFAAGSIAAGAVAAGSGPRKARPAN